jgi:hypothetical protein
VALVTDQQVYAQYQADLRKAEERAAAAEELMRHLAVKLARALTAAELRELNRTPLGQTPPAISVMAAALRHHEQKEALQRELAGAREAIEKHSARAAAHAAEAKRISRLKAEDEHERLKWQSKALKLRDEAAGLVQANKARVKAIERELAAGVV